MEGIETSKSYIVNDETETAMDEMSRAADLGVQKKSTDSFAKGTAESYKASIVKIF